jgi:hypothetical protein
VFVTVGGLADHVTGEIWPLIDWPKASVEVTWKVLEPSPSGTMML